jgi:stage V sporulation protein D (sporulation-specific penicillin-binding protein)
VNEGDTMRVSNVTLRRRLFVIFLGVAFLFVALVVRLGYVQLWKGPELAQMAEDSWRRNIEFKAKRGEIWDRNGERLAYNISSPSIMAVPVQVHDKEGTAQKLAGVLGMSSEKVYELITQKKKDVRIQPGGRKISLEKAQEVRELNLPGIYVVEDNKRYYPFGNLAAHVLGFTGIDNQGITGVELQYDKFLTGIDGGIDYYSTASGKEMPNMSDEYVKPRDGLALQLTLDKTIQTIMEREMDLAMARLQPNSIIGIAMDPNNGEILAMASRPTYEPDSFAEYPSEVYNRNLPIWMTYEPGSTFKIITLAAAIEEKKVNLLKDTFFDPGHAEVGGAHLRCWKRGGHGSQTFLEVVENSCNPGFVALGQRLGKDKLFSYIRQFGFGQKTGIDLGGEENGIMFKPSQVGPVELATTAFGQGVSVTPIQQVAAVAATVNGGKLYQPKVAKAWIDPVTGKTVSEIKPELVRQVISEETSQQVRMALESVVARGTGKNAFIDGYRVGGKTGTAQKVIGGRYSPNEHIVSFIGFAPADDPKVVIYIAVDNPKGIQFGGVVAAPIVGNIMEDTLRYMGVTRRKDQIEKDNYVWPDVPLVEVPNLVGKTKQDILYDLNPHFQLVTAGGTGNTIVSQMPKPGERVEQGSSIRVYLSKSSQQKK